MIGREALKNPDCFIEISNSLNNTNFKSRTKEEIKNEFTEFCKEHPPKEIYLKTIKDNNYLTFIQNP
jgi:tRNA-dihydrouridine synthase